MSEFFNVTLEKDIMLDDTSVKKNMTWSSEKILSEIVDKRLTKLEQLEDVDIVNKKNKQVLAFSKDTQKWTSIDIKDVGEANGLSIHQITKMGVVATPEKPHIVRIPINTLEFKVPRVNVLKYRIGEENILVTKNQFTNGESNDFHNDNMIEFDGKAHMKLEHSYKYDVIDDTEQYVTYSTTVDLDQFKYIEMFEDFTDGVMEKLKISAIPNDRILVPKGDMNLSNVEHIDFFKLIGTGVKMIVSADSGTTWKTFSGEKWINVDCTVKDIETKGLDISTFNNINDIFWNLLINNKKVRFAYLFSMNNIKDSVEIDDLQLQYDGTGVWMQVKEDLYDVIYSSNTLLEVHLKFGGDIKINY